MNSRLLTATLALLALAGGLQADALLRFEDLTTPPPGWSYWVFDFTPFGAHLYEIVDYFASLGSAPGQRPNSKGGPTEMSDGFRSLFGVIVRGSCLPRPLQPQLGRDGGGELEDYGGADDGVQYEGPMVGEAGGLGDGESQPD